MTTRKAKLPFDRLSDTECSFPGCHKRIKQRLVNDKPGATQCYAHHKMEEVTRGHFIDHQPRKKRIDAGLPAKSY